MHKRVLIITVFMLLAFSLRFPSTTRADLVCASSTTVDLYTCSWNGSHTSCLWNYSTRANPPCSMQGSDCLTNVSNCSSKDQGSCTPANNCNCSFSKTQCWINVPGGGGGGSTPGPTSPPSPCTHCETPQTCADKGGSWVGGGCGEGGLGTCNFPAGNPQCSGGGGDPGPPPPPPPPTCSISIRPAGVDEVIYQEINVFTAAISYGGGPRSSATSSWLISPLTPPVYDSNFVNANGTPASNLYTAGSTSTVRIMGTNLGGEDQLRVGVRVYGEGGSSTCGATLTYTVVPPGPWWQATGGDVAVGGNYALGTLPITTASVVSKIPSACTKNEKAGGSCRDELIIEDNDNGTALEPGIVISPASSSNNIFASSTLSGGNPNRNDNSNDWVARSYYNGKVYDYAYFSNLASGKKTYQMSSGETMKDAFNTAKSDPTTYRDADGYYYIRGPVGSDINTGNGALNIGTDKVVVLIDGKVTFSVNGKISVTEDSGGFFMLIASDDISVDPSLTTSSGANPYPLEGVFFTDGIFSTGTCTVAGTCPTSPSYDGQFSLNGMVTALSGVALDRDLYDGSGWSGDGNPTTPAEVFNYEPLFALNFPTSLADKHLYSREINP